VCNSFQFKKRYQLIVGSNDESLSVVSVCICCKSTRQSNQFETTPPRPTGFAEVVGDGEGGSGDST
jgi:hypothetical protein